MCFCVHLWVTFSLLLKQLATKQLTNNILLNWKKNYKCLLIKDVNSLTRQSEIISVFWKPAYIYEMKNRKWSYLSLEKPPSHIINVQKARSFPRGKKNGRWGSLGSVLKGKYKFSTGIYWQISQNFSWEHFPVDGLFPTGG